MEKSEMDIQIVAEAFPQLSADYEITALLGEGGMGKVYRAKSKALGCDVAIKVINPALVSDQSAVKRFELESKAASELTHANLVVVYDCGTSINGTPFIVMDLLEGRSLADLIQAEGYLDLPRALNLFIQICDAFIYAHHKGIIHRDLKPSNIFLIKGANDGELVKIIDFGIAKLLVKTEDGATQTGSVVGSPAYMSPEQCLGNETDARSDIYSLGCVMYETLTGRAAFSGANPIQTIVQQIENDAVLSNRECSALGISEDLQKLVLATLSKKKYRRYQSMEELREDLERIRDGLPPIHLPPLVEQLPAKTQATKMKLLPVFVGMLCLASTLVGLFLFASNSPRDLPLSENSTKSLAVVPPPVSGSGTEIRDIQNHLLYRATKAHNLSEAIVEAITNDVDLTRANFVGATFSNVMVSGQKHRAKLSEADFSKCSMTNCRFDNVDMHLAKFTDANLRETSLDGNFMNANFVRINQNFSGSIIDLQLAPARMTLPGDDEIARASSAVGKELPVIRDNHNKIIYRARTAQTMPGAINEALLSNADLSNANLSNLKLVGVHFNGKSKEVKAHLANADFSYSFLYDCDFANANLSGSKFVGTYLKGCHFDECRYDTDFFKDFGARAYYYDPGAEVRLLGDLSGADFSDANLSCFWIGRSVANAKFLRSNLTGARFLSATLTDTDFSGAILKDATFNSAVLTNANFHNADLSNVHMEGCQGFNSTGALNAPKAQR